MPDTDGDDDDNDLGCFAETQRVHWDKLMLIPSHPSSAHRTLVRKIQESGSCIETFLFL